MLARAGDLSSHLTFQLTVQEKTVYSECEPEHFAVQLFSKSLMLKANVNNVNLALPKDHSEMGGTLV